MVNDHHLPENQAEGIYGGRVSISDDSREKGDYNTKKIDVEIVERQSVKLINQED